MYNHNVDGYWNNAAAFHAYLTKHVHSFIRVRRCDAIGRCRRTATTALVTESFLTHCSGVYPFPGMLISRSWRPTNLGGESAANDDRYAWRQRSGIWAADWDAQRGPVGRPSCTASASETCSPVCCDKLALASSTVNSEQSGAPTAINRNEWGSRSAVRSVTVGQCENMQKSSQSTLKKQFGN